MQVESLIWPITAGLWGALWGSFLNVCIYRLPRDLSVVRPRSFCPGCEAQIAWYDNVPLLSYVLLRGRCRACGGRIEWRYPAVELLTGILFAAVAARYGWTLEAAKWMFFEGLMVALFWTDLETRLLPEELTLGGALAGLVFAVFVPVPSGFARLLLADARPAYESISEAALGAAVLAVPIWLIGYGYARVRPTLLRVLLHRDDVEFRDVLGLGDVSLLVLIGVFAGVEKGLTALLLGSVTGSVIGVAYLRLARKSALKYELPFGSFLCIGAGITPLLKV